MMVPNTRPRQRSATPMRGGRRLVFMEKVGAPGGELRYLIRVGPEMIHLMESWRDRQ